MALRRPLYVDGDGNLRVMDESHLDRMRTEAVRQFAITSPVDLTVLGSGGNLAAITDNRLRAGDWRTRADRFPTESETPEPSNLAVSYQRLNLVESTHTPASLSSNGYPLFLDGTDIRAMTQQDLIDTILEPAVQRLVGSSLAESDGGGTFFISSSSSSPNGSRVSSTPVFVDTRANAAAYSAGSIPEAIDQPTTITNYFLYEIPAPQSQIGNFPAPVFLRSDGHIQTMSESDIQNMIANEMSVYGRDNITYSLNGSGTNRGTGMTDTRLSGTSGDYETRFVNGNDYRAQEFPFGTPQTLSTTFLRIGRK